MDLVAKRTEETPVEIPGNWRCVYSAGGADGKSGCATFRTPEGDLVNIEFREAKPHIV